MNENNQIICAWEDNPVGNNIIISFLNIINSEIKIRSVVLKIIVMSNLIKIKYETAALNSSDVQYRSYEVPGENNNEKLLFIKDQIKEDLKQYNIKILSKDQLNYL